MACFAAPAALAIVTTAFRKSIPVEYHINWLNAMLWGGVAGLALEHAANGEIVPYFPFITALANPADTAIMLHEILTAGMAMTVVCVAVWAVMVMVASRMEAKTKAETRQTV